MTPSVSVAMATYNGERHLEEQLASLARQRLLPLELVVNDDGSADGTLAVLERFARRAPFPVRVERNAERVGFGDNFLRAAGRCAGDLIAFCDQDDVWLEGKLERAAAAVTGDVVLAVHACRVADEALVPTGATFPEVATDHVAPPRSTDPWLPVPGMAMTFDRRLLEVDATDRPPAHDLDAMIRHDEWVYLLARVTGAIAFIAEPLALYRQHGGNVTGAPRRGPLAYAREVRATGLRYYAARQAQAQATAQLLARRRDDPAWAAGAAEYEELARTLARRVPLYDPALPRRARVRRLGRLAAEGGYRGATGRFLKDLAAACSGR